MRIVFIDHCFGKRKTGPGYAHKLMKPLVCAAWKGILSSQNRVTKYEELLIDSFSVNRQGHDSGIQYRTGIYYTDEAQLPVIRAVFEREQEKAGAPLAVVVEPLKNFFSAEEYHQKYLEKNPGGYCHIPPQFFSLHEQQEDGMPCES